jgi:hypothetical protein
MGPLKTGDKVRSSKGGPTLRVAEVRGDEVVCYAFPDQSAGTGGPAPSIYRSDELVLIEREEPPTYDAQTNVEWPDQSGR